VTCGGGEQTCENQCKNGAFGDIGCSEDKKQSKKSCNDQECPTVEKCTVFGDCSKTCGGGEQTCENQCKNGEFGDIGCSEDQKQSKKSCNEHECPPVWGEWSTWSDCSATCGASGETTQTRTCQTGDNCDGDDSKTKGCNREVTCEATWGPWEDQGECSATCGRNGVISQTRTCQTGDNCRGTSERTQPCNRERCPRPQQAASFNLETTDEWSESLSNPNSAEFKALDTDIRAGLQPVLDETGATIISISFAASDARRRRAPVNNSGKKKKAKAIVELEIPIEEEDEVEGKPLEDIGKVVMEKVRVKVNQRIKQGKFGRLDKNKEAGATAKGIRQPKPKGDSPCPSLNCWDYNADTGTCSLKSGCTTVTCGDTDMVLSFVPALFGASVDGVSPAAGELTDIEMNGESQKGYQIRCGLGECDMTYKAAGGTLTFEMSLKKDLVGKQNFNGVSVLMGTRDISIGITCEYPMKIEVSSDKYNIMDVTTSGSIGGKGSLATGFELNLAGQSDDVILLGAMMDVTASWAVKKLPDISFYFTECGIVQEETTVNVIQSGCYANALKVGPKASTDSTQVGFSFKTFMVSGAKTNAQVVKCTIQLCTETCDPAKPSQDSECPTGNNYDYSVKGFTKV